MNNEIQVTLGFHHSLLHAILNYVGKITEIINRISKAIFRTDIVRKMKFTYQNCIVCTADIVDENCGWHQS